MISKELSEALLEAIGTVITEDGWYTIPETIYSCSSLSQGGSYYEKANNLIISDEFRDDPGVREKADYPGVYFVQFNTDLMDTDTAERLLSRLEDIRIQASSSVPCLDEDMAARLEAEDVSDALMETIEDIAFSGAVHIPDQCASDERFAALLIKANAGVLDLCSIECGPSVFIHEEEVIQLLKDLFPQNRRLHIGDRVWWADPEDNLSSKLGTVIDISCENSDEPDDIILIKDDFGGETEAYRTECTLVKDRKVRFFPITAEDYQEHYGEIVNILCLMDPYEKPSLGLHYAIAFQDGTEAVVSSKELL